MVNLEDLEVVGEHGFFHGFLHGVDDAGGDEHAVVGEKRGYDTRKGDDDVSEDVRHDDVVAFAVVVFVEFPGFGFIEDVDPVDFRLSGDAVDGKVLFRGADGVGVDIRCHGVAGAQFESDDGEDAAAGSHVQKLSVRFYVFFKLGNAQLGCLVGAAAEGCSPGRSR